MVRGRYRTETDWWDRAFLMLQNRGDVEAWVVEMGHLSAPWSWKLQPVSDQIVDTLSQPVQKEIQPCKSEDCIRSRSYTGGVGVKNSFTRGICVVRCPLPDGVAPRVLGHTFLCILRAVRRFLYK